MAIMGMSFVDGINEIIETILEFPMSGSDRPSTDGDTTSVYYRAEQFLDRENLRIQAWGWPENTRTNVAVTADSGEQTVTFATAGEVLKVRSAGPDSHRNLVLRMREAGESAYTSLYDADKGTFDVTDENDGTVYIDKTELLDFEYLPPHLQDVIVARAKWTFQRRMQGNMQLDASLMQEYMQAEAASLRNKPIMDQEFNVRPALPTAAPSPEGGGR